MTYTDPRTWVDGQTVAASALNTDLRDNVADLNARLAAIEFSGGRWTKTAAQTVADSTDTALTFPASEVYDEGGWGLTSSHTVTVPAGAIPAGFTSIVVGVGAMASCAGDADGRRILSITKNGTAVVADHIPTVGTTLTVTQAVYTEIDAEAGDTFQVIVFHTAGGNIDYTGDHFFISRRGPF